MISTARSTPRPQTWGPRALARGPAPVPPDLGAGGPGTARTARCGVFIGGCDGGRQRRGRGSGTEGSGQGGAFGRADAARVPLGGGQRVRRRGPGGDAGGGRVPREAGRGRGRREPMGRSADAEEADDSREGEERHLPLYVWRPQPH